MTNQKAFLAASTLAVALTAGEAAAQTENMAKSCSNVGTKGQLAACVWGAKNDADEVHSRFVHDLYDGKIPKWISTGLWEVVDQGKACKGLATAFQAVLAQEQINPLTQQPLEIKNASVTAEEWKRAADMFQNAQSCFAAKVSFLETVSGLPEDDSQKDLLRKHAAQYKGLADKVRVIGQEFFQKFQP